VPVSSTYFGNIAFWSSVTKEKKLDIDCAEYYQKQTYRNRTEILTANGIQSLSIPVIRPNGKLSSMIDIRIARVEDWQKDHWKSIESAYKHAPYFWYYGPEIKELIFSNEESLLNFNQHILEKVKIWLDLSVNFNAKTNFEPLASNMDNRIVLNQKNQVFEHQTYIQVFADKISFQFNLSILDALFNIGPLTRNLIVAQS
jgi:hypothetical protein